jgi:small subunit ribosomal protein S20
MPVTTTAKRALRGSKNKESINKLIIGKLEVAVRVAKKSKTAEKIIAAISLADKAAKKRVIHKNKAARIKSQLSKLMPKVAKKATKSKASPKK